MLMSTENNGIRKQNTSTSPSQACIIFKSATGIDFLRSFVNTTVVTTNRHKTPAVGGCAWRRFLFFCFLFPMPLLLRRRFIALAYLLRRAGFLTRRVVGSEFAIVAFVAFCGRRLHVVIVWVFGFCFHTGSRYKFVPWLGLGVQAFVGRWQIGAGDYGGRGV